MQSFFSPTKWRLLVTVLPLTAAFLLPKLAFHQLGWQPWKIDSLTGALFGAATFIIAFLLNGTLRDYNASADMPVQIVNSIETIQDTNQMMAEARDDYNPQPLKAALSNVLVELVEWLEENKTVKEVEVALDQLNPLFATLLNLGVPPVVNRLQAEQSKIRLLDISKS